MWCCKTFGTPCIPIHRHKPLNEVFNFTFTEKWWGQLILLAPGSKKCWGHGPTGPNGSHAYVQLDQSLKVNRLSHKLYKNELTQSQTNSFVKDTESIQSNCGKNESIQINQRVDGYASLVVRWFEPILVKPLWVTSWVITSACVPKSFQKVNRLPGQGTQPCLQLLTFEVK